MAAVAGIVSTAFLGSWQLGRAAQKEALQLAIEQQTAWPPIDNNALLQATDVSQTIHRKAVLRGSWVPQLTVFLDNRQMDDKAGFFVLTPFELADQPAGKRSMVMVQRGWVARHFLDRKIVPTITSPTGVVQIEGRIAPPPSKIYEFKGAENGTIRQNIDLSEYAREVKHNLLSVTLLQADATVAEHATDGMLRHWLRPNSGVEKHYGYAAQWLALSALIAILYGWFQIVGPLRQRYRQLHEKQ